MTPEEEAEWAKTRKFARSQGPVPDNWPKGVWGISQRGLNLLGLDERHRLYWDGEEIVVTSKLELTPWQRRLGVAVAVAAILASIAQFAPWLGIKDAAQLVAWFRSAAMSQIIGSLGLVLDIIGAVLLFRYGLPEDVSRGGASYELREEEDEAEKLKAKRYDSLGRLGLLLLIAGFMLQLVAIWLPN